MDLRITDLCTSRSKSSRIEVVATSSATGINSTNSNDDNDNNFHLMSLTSCVKVYVFFSQQAIIMICLFCRVVWFRNSEIVK